MEAFPHRCIGDAEAAYICVSPECTYKCPLLCRNYEKCFCRDHFHNNTNNFMKIGDFMSRVQCAEPEGLAALRKKLIHGLVELRDDLAKILGEQQKRINEFVDKVSKTYCKGMSILKNYKDIELKTGKDLKNMLVNQTSQQQQVVLPEAINARVEESLRSLKASFMQFKETFCRYAPTLEVGNSAAMQGPVSSPPGGSIQESIRKHIDSSNLLTYSDEAAPLKEILAEFPNIRGLICDLSIRDLKLAENFRFYASTTLEILSLSTVLH